MEARGAAMYPMVHRTVPTTKNDPTMNINNTGGLGKVTCLEPSQDLSSGPQAPSTVLTILLQAQLVSCYPLLVPGLVIGSPLKGEPATLPGDSPPPVVPVPCWGKELS